MSILRGSHAALSAPLVFLACACVSPTFAELGREACSDERDNDGDKETDCGDADCINSGACEQHASTCSDGVDNDGDDLVDCADEKCGGSDPCLAAPRRCNPLAADGGLSPDESECPNRMGCYVAEDGGTECRATPVGPDAGDLRTSCTIAPEASRQARAPCKPGLGCQVSEGASDGLCSPYCDSDEQCTEQGGLCVGMGPGTYGLCTVGCSEGVLGSTSELPCPPEFICVTGQNLGVSGAAGGYQLRCTHARSYVPGEISDTTTQCTDPGPAGEIPPPSERCVDTRVCHGPSFGESRCRELCALGAASAGACQGTCTSWPSFTDDGGDAPVGVCLPPS